MKPNVSPRELRIRAGTLKKAPGFALVISLSLMVLLTILAVGLLSLSTISIRSAGQSDSLSIARANARMVRKPMRVQKPPTQPATR